MFFFFYCLFWQNEALKTMCREPSFFIMEAAIKNMDSAYLTPLTRNQRAHEITDLPQANNEIRVQTHHWIAPSIKLIVHISLIFSTMSTRM